MVRRIQVTTSGGVHAAIAALLSQIAVEENAFISIKVGKKMTSVRNYMKVLSLGIRQYDWIEVAVESDNDENFIMLQVEKVLCSGRKDGD